MEFVPVLFKLERKSLLPILTVTGITRNVIAMEQFMLNKSLSIIKMAQNELEGKLMELMGHENEIKIREGMVAVRFYLIFKNDEEFDKAVTRIQKELG